VQQEDLANNKHQDLQQEDQHHKNKTRKKRTRCLIVMMPVKEGPARTKYNYKNSIQIKNRMSGGMMKPMGYRSGTMVKARGCKLGRTRPTKIT
jgi:hypothetical protein